MSRNPPHSTSPGRKCLVFNGDFHWFDADPAAFARVQQALLAHRQFLQQWPAGSDAHESYFSRICSGPHHRLDQALRIED